MEQKVAPGTGLTPRQEQLLDLAVKEPYILKTFYLSGGTALSSWYLHHRESYDLDFFSLQPLNYERIISWFRQKKHDIGYADMRFDEDFGFLTVHFRYLDHSQLKIDFNQYSRKKLQKGIIWHGLEIDSLVDIAVNKLSTIAISPRARDYIDFYLIVTKRKFVIDTLLKQTQKKFGEKIDIIQLAKNFLKVSEYTDFPKMLISFDEADMQGFYERSAGRLRSKILK